jgi:LPS-assembly lipoprotein
LALGALGLSACGFEPLYGRHGTDAPTVQGELETVQIQPIAERNGQRLYNHLRDRLNPRGTPGEPRYTLSIKLEESSDKLALTGDKTATRANLTVIASYELKSLAREEVLYRGRSRTVGGYNIVSNLFSTYSAEEDTRARAAEVLADDIRIKLALYFSRDAAGTSP